VAVAEQRFGAIARWNAQVVNSSGGVNGESLALARR
jgi:hypothetical protein